MTKTISFSFNVCNGNEIIAQDTERDNFMTAQEALEYGLIDKVLDKRD